MPKRAPVSPEPSPTIVYLAGVDAAAAHLRKDCDHLRRATAVVESRGRVEGDKVVVWRMSRERLLTRRVRLCGGCGR